MLKKIIAVMLAAVLLAAAFAGCSAAETEEPSGAIKIADTEYSLEEFNYMYVNMFNDIYDSLYSYYGNYLTQYLDVYKPLSEQDMGDGTSWHDYIRDYTLENMKNMTALYENAVAEGFELPESDAEFLESLGENFEKSAEQYSVTVPELIEDMYGKGVTYETVYKMTEMRLLAAAYAGAKEAEMGVTEEEMIERYESDKNSFDTVDFRFYNAYYSELGEYTDEDVAEYRAKAEALAAAKTEEEFKALAVEYASDDEKEIYENDGMTLYSGAGYDEIGIDELTKWLFDDERAYGDTYIYEDETYGGFIVAFFVERNGIDYDLVNVRHVLVQPEKGDDGTMTDEAWAVAEKRAQELLDGFLAGEATEEGFAAIATENSEDPGSASNGGLYSNIYKGQMVAPFENWCFDQSRKPGDTGIVKTSYGYHVMYFSSFGDNNLVSTMYDVVLSEKFNEWMGGLTKDIAVEEYDEFENVGGVIEEIVAAAEKYSGSNSSENSSED